MARGHGKKHQWWQHHARAEQSPPPSFYHLRQQQPRSLAGKRRTRPIAMGNLHADRQPVEKHLHRPLDSVETLRLPHCRIRVLCRLLVLQFLFDRQSHPIASLCRTTLQFQLTNDWIFQFCHFGRLNAGSIHGRTTLGLGQCTSHEEESWNS